MICTRVLVERACDCGVGNEVWPRAHGGADGNRRSGGKRMHGQKVCAGDGDRCRARVCCGEGWIDSGHCWGVKHENGSGYSGKRSCAAVERICACWKVGDEDVFSGLDWSQVDTRDRDGDWGAPCDGVKDECCWAHGDIARLRAHGHCDRCRRACVELQCVFCRGECWGAALGDHESRRRVQGDSSDIVVVHNHGQIGAQVKISCDNADGVEKDPSRAAATRDIHVADGLGGVVAARDINIEHGGGGLVLGGNPHGSTSAATGHCAAFDAVRGPIGQNGCGHKRVFAAGLDQCGRGHEFLGEQKHNPTTIDILRQGRIVVIVPTSAGAATHVEARKVRIADRFAAFGQNRIIASLSAVAALARGAAGARFSAHSRGPKGAAAAVAVRHHHIVADSKIAFALGARAVV
eukprot:comp21984_c0_seq1/m.50377 comp21984_c0_seq1/g.50377  ORF comp21984_c0_seq1/g.50377 comp21984_c0_seq1/m.50377 type:complete len:407 (-) comp21984_c0_seq1:1047-2267(-)